MKLRPLLFILLGLVLLAGVWTLLFGIPAAKKKSLGPVSRIVAGDYSPSDRLLVPNKQIANSKEVSSLVTGLVNASQKLAVPTLGSLRGPAIFLDEDGQPLVAAFYQEEQSGSVLYNVRMTRNGFEIMEEQSCCFGGLQRVFRFNLFEVASGKWTPTSPTTNFESPHGN